MVFVAMSWTLLMLLCALLSASAHYFSDLHSALFLHSPYLLLCSSFCFSHYYSLFTKYSKTSSTCIRSQTQSSSAWPLLLIYLFPTLLFFVFNINVIFFRWATVSWALRTCRWYCGAGSISFFFGWNHMRSRKKSPTWFGEVLLTNLPFWALCLVKF